MRKRPGFEGVALLDEIDVEGTGGGNGGGGNGGDDADDGGNGGAAAASGSGGGGGGGPGGKESSGGVLSKVSSWFGGGAAPVSPSKELAFGGAGAAGAVGEMGEMIGEAKLEKIHVFSLATGALYERMLKIMMLSVRKRTSGPVKFWLFENYLSPSFKVSGERMWHVRIHRSLHSTTMSRWSVARSRPRSSARPRRWRPSCRSWRSAT